MPNRKPHRKPSAVRASTPSSGTGTRAGADAGAGGGASRRRSARRLPPASAPAPAPAAAPPPAARAPSRKKLAHTRRLQAARRTADHKLYGLPNVVGSCFGVKHAGGVRTDQFCYTVLVTQKPAAHLLADSEIIPPTVTRLGRQMPTDVRVIGPLRREAGFAIDDGTQTGTVGAFARRDDGKYYALTCAHCIAGADADILIEYPNRFGLLLPLGVSSQAEIYSGTGMEPDFGEFDAAIAEVTAPNILQYVETRAALPVFQPDPTLGPAELAALLAFTPVQGWGAAANTILRGQIEGVMVSIQGQYFDLMITDPSGGGLTTRGDSGLLWTGPFGQAYGLHLAGDGPPGSSSPHAFACFAHRAVSRFGLSLLSA